MAITSVAPVVNASGISAPTYAEVLAYLQDAYRSIFGADVYLGADSQDGQFLAIVAASINDTNAAAVAVYNAFSPATAQGNGLASVVKTNGLARLVPTNSTVNVTLTGVAGTIIANGVVADTNNNLWDLPTSVTIPSGGSITVTATAQVAGDIAAASGTVTTIQTPVYGWQSVTNASNATPGAPVETDAALRIRQGNSVALPSLTVLAGIVGAVQAIAGVSACKAYENDTGSTDADGLPPHSIALVVEGGDAALIAAAIMQKKTPGALTYGTTTQVVSDSVGVPHTISFFVPTLKTISVAISLSALSGYTSTIADAIKAAVVAYISALEIGQDVLITRLYLPAQLNGAADAATFEIISVEAAISPGTPGTSDVAIAFSERAVCTAADVTITVV